MATTTPKSLYRGTITTSTSGTLDTFWMARSVDTGSQFLNRLVYNGTMFVGMGFNGTVVTSPDGINWTRGTNLAGATQWNGLAGSGTMFVAVTSNGTTNAASSPDGITWTPRTLSNAAYFSSVAYGGGLFFAVSSGTAIATASPDGITWSARTLPVSAPWSSVGYGGGLFVVLSSGGTIAASSPDGTTWTQRVVPSGNWTQPAYGNGMFVAVNPTTGAATSSPDGTNWTLRALPGSTVWSAVTFGGGLFLAVNGSSALAATSPDGITWTLRTMAFFPGSTMYNQVVVYGNGMYVTGGYSEMGTATTAVGQNTFYTVPAATTAILNEIYLANSSAAAATMYLTINGSPMLTGTTVPANDKLAISTRQVLDPASTVKGYTTSAALTLHLNGLEIA